jgi:sarcosine oxidase
MVIDTEVLVIGLGAMGAAALEHVARRGKKVWGMEQYGAGHDRGSSWGESRIIRQAYFEHPDYVPLVRRSWELWQDLEREGRETLLIPSGGLVMGAEHSRMIEGVAQSVSRWDIVHEWLDARDVHRRFPAIYPEAETIALFEPDGEILRPEAGIAAHLQRAQEAGARVAYDEAVRAWDLQASHIMVDTSKNRYRAETVIVSAGPWMPHLLPALQGTLWCERQPVFWTKPEDIHPFVLGVLPWYVWETSSGPQIYGFPTLNGETVKAGIHHTGSHGAPWDSDPVVSVSEAGQMQELFSPRFPGMGGEIAASHLCWYTNSPDDHFLVGPWPEDPRVVIAGGFSGHGYKFAPVIGEILADYALTGRTLQPCAFLRPERVWSA